MTMHAVIRRDFVPVGEVVFAHEDLGSLPESRSSSLLSINGLGGDLLDSNSLKEEGEVIGHGE